MEAFRKYDHVFLIGIGGIGMSALARFFYSAGHRVAGYDRTSGPVTNALLNEGVVVLFEEEVNSIPSAFTNPSNTLVIYTPAVPGSHQQLEWFRQKDFKVLKRSQVLGLITEDMKSVCVAGTHGKTTVSTLTAYLLHNSSLGANAFLGGIPKNFGTNFLHDQNSDLVVLEADEFDRSFWQLTPSTALITSMDADHLDVYGNSDKVREGFTGFAARIKKNGTLLIKAGLPVPEGLAEGVEVFTYSRENEPDYKIINLKYHKGLYSFDLKTPEGKISGFTSGMPGLVNV
ncbi:MAG: Mur ligase family protein, partial [Marinilabilia sp.]